MATTNITQKKPCSKCNKGGGIFTCDGCHQSFCRKHSDEHRQELAIQMDAVGQVYDVLQRDINKEADAHPLLSRIDAWEQESINKVQQVAKQARTDLNQLINQKKQELKITMGPLTNELQCSREAEDYTELDLKKWIDQLQELRQDLERSTNTYLVDEEDQRSIIHLIKVKNVQQLRSFMQSIGTPNRNSNTHLNSISSNISSSTVSTGRKYRDWAAQVESEQQQEASYKTDSMTDSAILPRGAGGRGGLQGSKRGRPPLPYREGHNDRRRYNDNEATTYDAQQTDERQQQYDDPYSSQRYRYSGSRYNRDGGNYRYNNNNNNNPDEYYQELYQH